MEFPQKPRKFLSCTNNLPSNLKIPNRQIFKCPTVKFKILTVKYSNSQPSNIQTQGSVKPIQACLLSLPPHIRYKEKYMLILGVIPNELKLQAAKKYYDFMAHYELNQLHHRGKHK